jgi:hypothetical protein
MRDFFYLEGAYLILGGIVLLVTLFITTRPFMSKTAPRNGLLGVGAVIALLVGGHFYVTTTRMAEVKNAFQSGKSVLCESRMLRKAAQYIEIRKDTEANWRLEGDEFVSDSFVRPFHTARCIVKLSPVKL